MGEAEVPFEARADKSLLIVDDDKTFSTRLARAMEEWLHVENIREEYREEEGDDPSYGDVFVALLREFHGMRPVYNAVSKHLDLPRQNNGGA